MSKKPVTNKAEAEKAVKDTGPLGGSLAGNRRIDPQCGTID